MHSIKYCDKIASKHNVMPDLHFDVIIVGAGCAGLSAASVLKQKKILVLEKEQRIGGRVYTRRIGEHISEVGALFPIQGLRVDGQIRGTETRGDTSKSLEINYIDKSKRIIRGHSVEELFKKVSTNTDGLQRFLNPVFIINHNLGLKVRNERYGDINNLDQYQLELLEAVYQVTHSGSVKRCLKTINPLVIQNVIKPQLECGNSDRLAKIHEGVLDRIQLGSEVCSIKTENEKCTVSVKKNGELSTISSQYVIVTAPPPSIFNAIVDINQQSLAFYGNISYQAGSVCIFSFFGKKPKADLTICSSGIWSAVFCNQISDDEYLLHVYIPERPNHISQTMKASTEDIYVSIKELLPSEHTLNQAYMEHWPYLSPSIHNEIHAKYHDNHHHLTKRVWYGGELARFSPLHSYTFGTNAAMKAGSEIGEEIRLLLQDKHFTAKEGLFDSELYRISNDAPKFLSSRRDGNVAFYGILASAYKQESVINYLSRMTVDGQWEFHKQFGATLEDSLIAAEGLIDNIGVKKFREKYDINQYFDDYWLEEEKLFTTTKHGCSNYWKGPSLLGNAHMLFTLNRLNCKDERVDHDLIYDYLIGKQKPNLLWESKWFADDYYTSFYVIRCLIGSKTLKRDALNVRVIAQSLLQKLLLHEGSELSIVSGSYIVRSLVQILQDPQSRTELGNLVESAYKACEIFVNKQHATQMIKSETLLYYWQDIEQSTNHLGNKLMITSAPSEKLSRAMLELAVHDFRGLKITD